MQIVRDRRQEFWQTDGVPVPNEDSLNPVVVGHPLIRVKLAALRDKETPSREFRRLMTEISALMAFEVTRNVQTVTTEVRSPLRKCAGEGLLRPFSLVPILRAGLGMLEGFSKVLPDAGVGHIGMYRNEETLRPETYFFKMPTGVCESELILLDPMLATGWSASEAIADLKRAGVTRIRFASIVSCPEGINVLSSNHPEVRVFTAAIDEGLNGKGYIVPGLGDAGDRYYGTL